MATLTFIKKDDCISSPPKERLQGKRNLSPAEISVLVDNLNTSEDYAWRNVFVDENDFDPTLIKNSLFSGFIVLGKIRPAKLKFHDLELKTGIYNATLEDVVIGDDVAIHNASIKNYRMGNRIMLFNVQEMDCTNHSKFGNGILKEGESESVRIDISVANENGGRAILPFESMIAADAYIWSKFRDDACLMERLKEITEQPFSKSLDTFGVVEDDVVIKNTTLIKDTKIGKNAYIKGVFKIKNVTVLSSYDEPTQIGEGVELVNGIVGFGCHIFYQAVAVRFVIGRNCQLKYGARLLNSVLGDNSTISCCELLNNLIFPFHEQHHNSSFLIATTVMGQSNIAAGATIGSNHNSRSPDGEIIASRGFWPGLCSSFKHNSRFASFVLASKGVYPQELDIQYPFALLLPPATPNSEVLILPAWWFTSNMFAIIRNKYKFNARDKRVEKIQHIETNPLAPDTIQEVVDAIIKIIELTAENFSNIAEKQAKKAKSKEELRQSAKDFLHKKNSSDFTLHDSKCQRKFGGIILKPAQSYKMYRKIVKYFAAQSLIEYCEVHNYHELNDAIISEIQRIPLYKKWVNLGGQVIPEESVFALNESIKSGKINSWEEIHAFYDDCDAAYTNQKARYSLYLLERLYSKPIEHFSSDIYDNIVEDVIEISNEMYASAFSSREKDFSDYYRSMTYRNKEEMEAVLGDIHHIEFLETLKSDTEKFNKSIESAFCILRTIR